MLVAFGNRQLPRLIQQSGCNDGAVGLPDYGPIAKARKQQRVRAPEFLLAESVPAVEYDVA
jgi:hypothetical protein